MRRRHATTSSQRDTDGRCTPSDCRTHQPKPWPKDGNQREPGEQPTRHDARINPLIAGEQQQVRSRPRQRADQRTCREHEQRRIGRQIDRAEYPEEQLAPERNDKKCAPASVALMIDSEYRIACNSSLASR